MTFYLVGPFYPLRGGIAQYIGVLGQKLEVRGHAVRVLSFRKQFPKLLFPGQTQIETSQDYIKLDTRPVFIPWNPCTWLRTFWAIRRGKPNAVIFKYWMPFFAPGYAAVCGLTKWLTSVRIIYIVDNVIPHEKRPGDRFFTRLAFRWVDAFIVQSDVVRQDLLRWFPEAKRREVKFVHHPIYDCYTDTNLSREKARQKLGLKAEGKLLLFFGLVRHYKGLDVLIEAFPHIVASLGEDVHLLVAGEFYETEETYWRRVEELDLSHKVAIVNKFIPNEDVGTYFRAADLLVLPYRSATQSGVIQVAFHFELPVISTRVGGLPEVVRDGETGFLVPPEDPKSLAEAVVKFFRDDTRDKIIENMRKEKERYSWDKMVETMEEIAGKDTEESTK